MDYRMRRAGTFERRRDVRGEARTVPLAFALLRSVPKSFSRSRAPSPDTLPAQHGYGLFAPVAYRCGLVDTPLQLPKKDRKCR